MFAVDYSTSGMRSAAEYRAIHVEGFREVSRHAATWGYIYPNDAGELPSDAELTAAVLTVPGVSVEELHATSITILMAVHNCQVDETLERLREVLDGYRVEPGCSTE